MIFNIPSSYYNLTSPDLVYWSQYDCGYHNRGEEIIIKKAGIPVAVIRQYVAQSSERVPGALAGKIKISPDFDELPPQIAKAFGMEVWDAPIAGNSCFISSATVWEISIKSGLGKLDVAENYLEVVNSQGFIELPVAWRHANAVKLLPDHHKDPFDRILIAQAQIEGMTLVCSDSLIAKYDVSLIWKLGLSPKQVTILSGAKPDKIVTRT